MTTMTADELATSQGLTLARGMERLAGGWLVWFGRSTRHFWAISPSNPHELIEADSAEELLRRLLGA